MAFFSNVILDIETYVDNWMMCLAANIHWFLIKKGCDKDDVIEVRTPKRAGRTILDLSGMKEVIATVDLGVEVEVLS